MEPHPAQGTNTDKPLLPLTFPSQWRWGVEGGGGREGEGEGGGREGEGEMEGE